MKILLNVPEDMTEGSRRIIECPVCGHKVYVLRDAGEVCGKFAKCVRDVNGIIDGERKEAIKKELGDVCWFVSEIATILDLKLEDVMQGNLDKLASRKERGVIHGDGDNRYEYIKKTRRH